MGYRLHGRDLVYRGTPNTEYLFCFPRTVWFQPLFHTEITFLPAHTFYLQRSMPFFALNVPRETAIFMKNSWEVSHETKIWIYLADADIKLSKIREKFHVKHY